MIRVLVTGAAGKMGRQVAEAVLQDPNTQLVGAVDVDKIGAGLSDLIGKSAGELRITDDLAECIRETSPQVLVDFTTPQTAMGNITTALENKVHVVVGTTGLKDDDLVTISKLAEESGTNAIIAPNFATGAVLMMKFARLASKYFDAAEIIEMHHEKKIDAPSGTALKTAQEMDQASLEDIAVSKETVEGARGGKVGKVRIHSVRLPGLVAHQEVILGSKGQILTIRHDSIDRTSFMPGVLLAIKEVEKRKGLTYGLDKLLDI